MAKIKKLDNPVKYLYDSGLLFAINHQLLHPLGLAFDIIVDEKTGEVELGGVWDYRDHPEGILFKDETLIHGMEKLSKFMEEFGNNKLQERYNELGFIQQPLPEPEKPKKKRARKNAKNT